jgi:hypothetical protein
MILLVHMNILSENSRLVRVYGSNTLYPTCFIAKPDPERIGLSDLSVSMRRLAGVALAAVLVGLHGHRLPSGS